MIGTPAVQQKESASLILFTWDKPHAVMHINIQRP